MIGFQRRNLNVWYRLDFLDEKIFGPLNGTAIEPEKVSDEDYLTKRYTHQLQADWRLDNRLSVNLALSYQGLQAPHADHLDRPLDRREMALGRRCQSGCHPVQSLDRTGDGNLEYRPEDQPSARFGIPMDRRQGGRIDGTPISDLAFFISAEYKPWSWMSVRPGVRAFLMADYEAPVAVPSILTKFDLTPDMDIRLSYAYGFRTPTLQELYFRSTTTTTTSTATRT